MGDTLTVSLQGTAVPVLPRFAGLFRVLGKWLASASLSEDERDRLEKFVEAVIAVGSPLLDAADRSDLDDRIDRACGSPRLYETLELILDSAVTGPERPRPASRLDAADTAARFVRVLGPAAMRPFVRGLQHVVAAADAGTRLEIGKPGQDLLEDFLDRSKRMPLWFVADPETSAQSARALLHTLQALIDLFAIGAMALRARRLERWLPVALAERWERDTYQALRAVASVPGADVPEDVVPISDRFDLERAEQQAFKARQHADDLFQKAEEKGDLFYPPLDE